MPAWLKKHQIHTPIKINHIRNAKEALLYVSALITFLYHRYWLRKDLEEVTQWLRDHKDVLQTITTYVPNATKYAWTQPEVSAYPVIGQWAAARHGALLVGIRPHGYLTISIVLHELIHANTHPHIQPDTEHELAEELATVLMTRKIEKELLHLESATLQQSPVELSMIGINDAVLETLDAAVAHTESFKNIYAYAAHALQDRR